MHYSRNPVVLEGYSDAGWISDIQDTKGTSGYVFTLERGVVSWKSSRQTIITRSTMESESAALDKTGEEVEWLRQFLEDIPKWPKRVPTVFKSSSKVRDLVSSAAVEDHPLLYPGRPMTLDLKHRGAVESVLRKLRFKQASATLEDYWITTQFL
ncbi:hypothetical protein V6N11_009235 [Hibiscus sabdariffa]|uniref:Uncharacterized protein n=1 Tax=Hibiscus sabdariffa TaxID=183260 RepID=A0ABR2PQ83_9ROSI